MDILTHPRDRTGDYAGECPACGCRFACAPWETTTVGGRTTAHCPGYYCDSVEVFARLTLAPGRIAYPKFTRAAAAALAKIIDLAIAPRRPSLARRFAAAARAGHVDWVQVAAVLIWVAGLTAAAGSVAVVAAYKFTTSPLYRELFGGSL